MKTTETTTTNDMKGQDRRMKFTNAIAGAIALAAVAVVAAPSHALVKIGVSSGIVGDDITFGGTPSGDLMESSAFGTYLNEGTTVPLFFFPVTVKLSTSGTPVYSYNAGTGSFTDTFTGGSFDVFETLAPSTVLVEGTFGASSLTGTVGSSSGSLQLAGTSVVYNPVSTALDGISLTGGSFTLGFNSVTTGATPGFVASSSGLNAFKATDDINFFGASPAPEPSQFGMMALMGLGLTGLIIRARKSRAASGLST